MRITLEMYEKHQRINRRKKTWNIKTKEQTKKKHFKVKNEINIKIKCWKLTF